ncbi:uncharacterized protein [Panulirus ornatus]|uniref:uncharacterized protein n=1 Tax=Panulirus ornatus TaxID=150431 RepID=UPI003A8B145A
MSGASCEQKSGRYVAEGGMKALLGTSGEDLELTSSDSEADASRTTMEEMAGYQEKVSKKEMKRRREAARRNEASGSEEAKVDKRKRKDHLEVRPSSVNTMTVTDTSTSTVLTCHQDLLPPSLH